MNVELRRKALAHLRAGRVTIRYADSSNSFRSSRVSATVESSRGLRHRHLVDFAELRSGLSTTCASSAGTCEQPCAHVAAVALVTGWPTEARP